jgi:CubicO group peptidase (beta-lactamase class C family)
MYSAAPAFESGAGGLVSAIDDLLSFGRMMLGHRAAGVGNILSRSAIELMTMDHLTQQEKGVSPFFEHFWDCHGWGLGLGS